MDNKLEEEAKTLEANSPCICKKWMSFQIGKLKINPQKIKEITELAKKKKKSCCPACTTPFNHF